MNNKTHTIYRVYCGNGKYSLWYGEFEEKVYPKREMVGNGYGTHIGSYKTREKLKEAISKHTVKRYIYTVFE